MNVQCTACLDVNAAAMRGRRIAGDRTAIEVQRAACLDVDCAAISRITWLSLIVPP